MRRIALQPLKSSLHSIAVVHRAMNDLKLQSRVR
jgi:hypothetical protein